MTIRIIPESHVDHNLTQAQLQWVMDQPAPKGEVHVQTLTLPEDLGTVPCALYGPVMGDAPIPDDVTAMITRGERKGPSRMYAGEVRQTRLITVVSGPGPEPTMTCVLYTSYGGPAAPREVFEDDSDEARDFWAQHALSQ